MLCSRPLITGLLLIACTFSFSQTLVHTTYTFDDGLPSSNVFCVEQDASGYIWAITEYGASRYNNETFTTFDMSNGFTDRGGFHIYKDKKGVLWFIPYNGHICYHDGTTFKIPAWFNAQKYGTVAWMTEDTQGNYCFVTRTGMLVILHPDGKITSLKVSEGSAYSIVEGPPGIYLVQLYAELKWVNAKTGKTGKINAFYNDYSKLQYARLKRLKSGRVLLTSSEGVFEITDALQLKKLLPVAEKYKANYEIFNIYEDGEGNIWMPSRGGLLKFDSTLDIKKSVTYFKGTVVLTMMKDSEDNIWLATSGGLIKVLSEGAYYLSKADGLASQYVRQLCNTANNNVFALTHDGNIYNINNDKILPLVANSSTAMSDGLILEETKKGELFIKTVTTALTFNIKTKKINLLNDYYISSLCYHAGTFYFTDIDGMGYLKNNNREYILKKSNDIPFNTYINCMAMDVQGNAWIGCKEGLVKITRTGKYTAMGNENQVCNAGVSRIQVTSKGTVWVATTLDIIYCINNKKITSYTLPAPFNTRIKNLTLCHDTVLWVATSNGAFKFVARDNKLQLVYCYNIHNSLISSDISSIAESGDKVYFATSKGISVVNQKLYRLKNVQPQVLIGQLAVGNINVMPMRANGLEVDYNNNFLSVNTDAAVYSWGKIKYKYRLEPLDTGWEQTFANTIKYSSLPPGNYVFKIKAANLFGQESVQEQSFAFSIRKPYWLAPWFWILALITVSGIVYILVKYRLNKVQREAAMQKGLIEAQLKAIRLQMNPHFIFNSLQSIQDYIITHQNKLAVNYLSKFSKLVRRALDYSKQNFISLKEDIEMLDLYVELEKNRFDGRLEYTKQIDELVDTEKVLIPPMLVQPFIENAIKHGIGPRGEGEIILSVTASYKYLYIEIKDNGIGREAAAKTGLLKTGHKSTGINYTIERLNMVFASYGLKGSSIDINDLYAGQKPAGTQVIIKIPYGDRLDTGSNS